MTYNGWSNYETWAVGLYLDGNYDEANRLAESADNVYDLSIMLQTMVSESPSITAVQEHASIAADLLGAALSEVNWQELAESRFAEVHEATP